jgi:hypothetical protein
MSSIEALLPRLKSKPRELGIITAVYKEGVLDMGRGDWWWVNVFENHATSSMTLETD